jgi:hypothetical protein
VDFVFKLGVKINESENQLVDEYQQAPREMWPIALKEDHYSSPSIDELRKMTVV